MHSSRRAWLGRGLGLAAALLIAWGPPQKPAQAQGADVIVFAAASLKNALDAINAQWRKETGKKAAISYAASPALARQIEAGAPAQVFISADLDWMDYLAQKNLIKPDTRSNLLGNRIVLIAPKDKAQAVEIKPGFDLAKILGDGRLSMANVDAVPAGKYGKAALEKLGVWASVSSRIAQAENVRAALLLVSRGETPGRHRLPDRRRGRRQRQDHRHFPGEHAPADHLSDRADRQCRAPGCRGVPRLHQVGEGQAPVRGAGVHGAEPTGGRRRPRHVQSPPAWPAGRLGSDALSARRSAADAVAAAPSMAR